MLSLLDYTITRMKSEDKGVTAMGVLIILGIIVLIGIIVFWLIPQIINTAD